MAQLTVISKGEEETPSEDIWGWCLFNDRIIALLDCFAINPLTSGQEQW